MTVVRAAALTPDGARDAALEVADGRVAALSRGDVVEDPAEVLAPGLVDLQVNGGWGIDLTSRPEGLWELATRLPSTGVTAFLPTLVSTAPATVDRALDVLAAGPPDGWRGAVPLGWHLEGPFLAPARRGAHHRDALRDPDPALLAAWLATGRVRMVTLAPERPGADALVSLARDAGVVVAAGHSEATFDEAVDAFAAGVTAVTHLGNAMTGLHHRAPGLVGAALATPGVVLGVIADGQHVHPAVLAIVARLAADRVALVTDAVAAAGLASDSHVLGDVAVTTVDGAPRDADGRLAGSTLSLPAALHTWRAATGQPLGAAIRSVTAVPARLVGAADRGTLDAGARADWCVLDADGRVTRTVVGGEVVFEADRDRP